MIVFLNVKRCISFIHNLTTCNSGWALDYSVTTDRHLKNLANDCSVDLTTVYPEFCTEHFLSIMCALL
jgi:hypothetical protein